MLKEKTLFETIDKVQVSIDRLKQFEPPEGYHLAFSGGKDSCVIMELAYMADVKFQSFYNVTTIDPPQLIYFMKKYHSDVEFRRPKKHLLSRMVEKGCPPTRLVRWCCDEYKETVPHDWFVVMGVRRAESAKRSKREMFKFCENPKRAGRQLNPIIDWTDMDVWEFIDDTGIYYCDLYDEGFKRLGCVMCPIASQKSRDMELERFPKIKELYIKYFGKLYEKLKKAGKPACKKWESGEEMFWWWMDNNAKGIDKDQFMMFD